MKRTRVLGAAAAAACVALAIPAHAAGRAQITDPKGDGGSPGDDIVSVTFASTFKTVRTVRKPTGYTVKLVLAGTPEKQTWYRVEVTTPKCPTFYFEYAVSSFGANTDGADCLDGVQATYDPHIAAPRVSGSTVTWRVPLAAMRAGTKLTNLRASTETFVSDPVGVATVGIVGWDDAAARPGTAYTVGR